MDPEGNTKKSRRQRRNSTDEFRTGAARLVIEEGKTIAEVARNLGTEDLRPWTDAEYANW